MRERLSVLEASPEWLWALGLWCGQIMIYSCVGVVITCGGMSIRSGFTEPSLEWTALQESDLEPIPLGKHEKRIRVAIKRSAWREASQLITEKGAPQTFLKAWFYAQAESWERVLSHLKGLEQHPILGDEVLALKAAALMKLDRASEAEAAGVRVSRVDESLWRENLRVRGQALRALKRWDDAVKTYESLAQSPESTERGIAALGLGMVAIERGDLKTGVRLLKDVDVNYPGSWVAGQAQREAGRVTQKHNELRSIWSARSTEERLKRLEGLLDRGRSQAVLDYVPRILNSPLSDELKCRALIAKGRAYDKLRKRAQALTTLKRAIKLCHPQRHPKMPLALYVAGRAASYTNHRKDADVHF